jgi:hypothetical protein
MVDLFGMDWEKIIYCAIRPKLSKIVISNKHNIKLEEYLIFSNTLPSALLEYFAFKEVYGQMGLPQ